MSNTHAKSEVKVKLMFLLNLEYRYQVRIINAQILGICSPRICSGDNSVMEF